MRRGMIARVRPMPGGGIAPALRGGAVTVALCCWLSLAARAQEPVRVAVDWSEVRDADVERCGLARLRAGTIERLVARGHAVVETVDASGIQVSVASTADALQVRVQSGDVSRVETLPAGETCDATFALEAIARIAELVEEVARARPQPLAADVELGPVQVTAPAAEPAEGHDARARVQAALDLTARFNESPDFLLGGGVGVRVRHAGSWESGLRAELTGNGALGVTVMEAFLGATAAYQPALPGVAPYLELGPLLHLGSSDARSQVELDGALGAGVQLSLGHLLAHLLLQGRLRSFEHRVGEETAHDTGRIGVVVRIGGQLSGS
jgi:hypothetical protein